LAPNIAGRTAFRRNTGTNGTASRAPKEINEKKDLSRPRRDSLPACGQRVSRLHDKRAASSIDVNNLRRPKFGTRIARQHDEPEGLVLGHFGSWETLCH
jgi:hypothetical protein